MYATICIYADPRHRLGYEGLYRPVRVSTLMQSALCGAWTHLTASAAMSTGLVPRSRCWATSSIVRSDVTVTLPCQPSSPSVGDSRLRSKTLTCTPGVPTLSTQHHSTTIDRDWYSTEFRDRHMRQCSHHNWSYCTAYITGVLAELGLLRGRILCMAARVMTLVCWNGSLNFMMDDSLDSQQL